MYYSLFWIVINKISERIIVDEELQGLRTGQSYIDTILNISGK